MALTDALKQMKPVTLDRDDDYYRLLKELCNSFKKEIISPDVEIDPEIEREKILKRRDESERLLTKERIDPNNQPIELQNMNKSLRSIEVVGQIVKNRHGSLQKVQINSLIKELYMAAFRTISYFGNIIESDRTQVINDILKHKKDGVSDNELKNRLETFFELASLNFCLFVFMKIISCVGNKDLRSIFTQVAKEIDTPAAKLVSFSIISCFSKISVQDLKDLVEELKDNPVAMSIIRARVRSYLYNTLVSYSDRQRIINAINLNPTDKKIAANRINGLRR